MFHTSVHSLPSPWYFIFNSDILPNLTSVSHLGACVNMFMLTRNQTYSFFIKNNYSSRAVVFFLYCFFSFHMQSLCLVNKHRYRPTHPLDTRPLDWGSQLRQRLQTTKTEEGSEPCASSFWFPRCCWNAQTDSLIWNPKDVPATPQHLSHASQNLRTKRSHYRHNTIGVCVCVCVWAPQQPHKRTHTHTHRHTNAHTRCTSACSLQSC